MHKNKYSYLKNVAFIVLMGASSIAYAMEENDDKNSYNFHRTALSSSVNLNKEMITETVCSNLKNWTKITELNLSNVKLEWSTWTKWVSWDEVFNSVGSLVNLTSLNLSSNNLGYLEINPLGRCLGKLHSLTNLELQGQDFLNRDLSIFNEFSAILPQNAAHLKYLHIDNVPGAIHLNLSTLPLSWAIPLFRTSPEKSINVVTTNLLSLPSLVSLTLYSRDGGTFEYFLEQDTLKNKLNSQKGSRKIQVNLKSL